MTTRARLIDVARLAGVSLGSASRALSAPDKVKPKTREAVRIAADELDYVPNGAARSLATRRSFTVAVVLPTVNNPVYADFVHALQKALNRDGYLLLVAAHEYDRAAEAAIVARLLERGVDGVLLVGTDHDPAVLVHLGRARAPYLFTWSDDEAAGRDCVGFSNRRAMRRMAEHLAALGHTRVAVLSGALEHNERARARLDGVRDVLALAPDQVICGDFSVGAGRAGLRRAWGLTPRPTALICATDLLAAGALAEARDLGIEVPRDLSVTGFDDIEIAGLLTPALTTISVPTAELGARAAQAVLRRIEGKPFEAPVLEATLTVRASTAQPRAE